MADEPQTEAYIKGLWERFKEKASGMSGVIGPGYNAKSLTEDEEDLIWSKRALTIEQEWDLWRQGKTPEEIGMAVFPEREKLIKSGGRIEPKQWIAKANQLAARAERKRTQQQQPAQPMLTEGMT